MAAKYWLKLYHEMLDDPKVMTLRPALRWRFIETLLVAGECDEDGYLPAVDAYAWRVRSGPEVTETELAELANAGLLSRDGGRYLVTRFAERQAPVSDAERMRRYRDRKQLQEYNELVTTPVTIRNVDTDTDTEEEEDTDKMQMAPAVVYANVTGFFPSPVNAQRINDILNSGPIDQDVLAHAYRLWLDCGYSAANPAMCEWYHNLKANPNWQPPKKRGASEQKETAEERLERIFADGNT